MIAKKFVVEGSRMRVGDGKSIRIWGDKWLQDEPFSIQSPPPVVPFIDRVIDLMLPYNQGWNEQLIAAIFPEDERKRIMSIPLAEREEGDRRVWVKSEDGEFSVSSRYKLILSMTDSLKPVLMGPISPVWVKIWNLDTPENVKFYAWRAASDLIPVMRRLKDRGKDLPLDCPCCGNEVETLIHLLRDCKYAREVWQKSSFNHLVQEEHITVQGWFLEVANMVSSRDFAGFMVVCWNIWYARNRRVWEGVMVKTEEVVQSSSSFLKSYYAAKAKKVKRLPPPPVSAGPARWKPPPQGWVKVNVDAAIFESEGATGMGAVVRDAGGRVKHARSCVFSGRVPALQAEFRAIRQTLRWLLSRRMSKVIMESDSLLAVTLIGQDRISRCDEVGVLARSCQFMLASLREVIVRHVRRGANAVADELARRAITVGGDYHWVGQCPANIVELVQSDLRS